MIAGSGNEDRPFDCTFSESADEYNDGDEYTDNFEYTDNYEYECDDDEMEEQLSLDRAVETARRYSPWVSNRGSNLAASSSSCMLSTSTPSVVPLSSSPPPPPKHSPTELDLPLNSPKSGKSSSSSKGSKSRPWRVDVLLKKGKSSSNGGGGGVQRSTISWKQQMQERKQVFALSGVTVMESNHDQEEDIEEDIDNRSLHVFEEEKESVIEVTNVRKDEQSSLSLPTTTITTSSVIEEVTLALNQALQEEAVSVRHLDSILERQQQQQPCYDDQDYQDDLQSVASVRSMCSATVIPSSLTTAAAVRNEETRTQETNRRALLQTLHDTFRDHLSQEDERFYTITTMGRAGLDPPKLPKNEYSTAYARIQRSRLVTELSQTLSLRSMREQFPVVETRQEQLPSQINVPQQPIDFSPIPNHTPDKNNIDLAVANLPQEVQQEQESSTQSTTTTTIIAMTGADDFMKDDEVTAAIVEQTVAAIVEVNHPSTTTTASTSSTLTPTKPAFSSQHEPATASSSSSNNEEPVAAAAAAGGKKNKASKWKDRLAKRKSVSKRDSDISMNNNDPNNNNSSTTAEPIDNDATVITASETATAAHTSETAVKQNSSHNRPPLHQSLSSDAETPQASTSSKASPPSPPDESRDSSEETKEETPEPSPTATGQEPSSCTDPIMEPTRNDAPLVVDRVESCHSTKAVLQDNVAVQCGVDQPPPPPLLSVAEQQPVLPPAQSNGLRNSFLAFDMLLQQRQGGPDLQLDGDEYSEYTIEESVLLDNLPAAVPPSNAVASLLLKGTGQQDRATSNVRSNKAIDNESQYEEITEEQSFMEFTVEETVDDSHRSSRDIITRPPIHHATMNLMSSRMFNTPQVATTEEPIITVQHIADDDDDMTQLTFDQSHVGPYAKKAAQVPASSLPPLATTTTTTTERKPPSDSSTKASNSMHESRGGSGDGSRNRGSSLNESHRRSSHNRSITSSSRGGVSSTSSERNNKRVSELLRKDIWSKDAKVVEEAMDIIVNEACMGSKYRAKIVQCGGIMGIVRAMESHPDAAAVQVNACAALDRMAMDPETQVIISEMGGISAVLDAMKKHTGDEDVHQAGCSALASITRHRGTTDEAEGAVQVLCASMTRHSTNMLVQAKAFGAIANLCMDNEHRLKELSDAGGMLAMTMALQQPWPSKTEKHEAISNLAILLRCLAEHEGGDQHDEEYDDCHDQSDEDSTASVISRLEDASVESHQDYNTHFPPAEKEQVPAISAEDAPTIVDHQQPIANDTVANAATATSTATTTAAGKFLPEANHPPVKEKVQKSLGLEQGSNSTQPTESTSRDADDENCAIS